MQLLRIVNLGLQEAIAALNSLVTNADTLRQSEEKRRDPVLHVPQVASYLQRVGLTTEQLEALSVIHIAGTKGKGSTGAFSESILRQYGYKTGFFTSPHLIEDRERILLNGKPISEKAFSFYFWHVFNKLDNSKDEHDGDMPFYFSFLTVMALYVFVHEKVDVVILEVGIGGQYDSTNVISSPRVCGITTLDFDHTSILGNTMEEIAWNKAGIFKAGIPAFTVEQCSDSAMTVLLQRSKEIQCPLFVVPALSLEKLGSDEDGAKLGISGDRQLFNAALALLMCRVFMGNIPEIQSLEQPDVNEVQNIVRVHVTHLSAQEKSGLRHCYWPGRSQTIVRDDVTFYLDGAHTPDSIQYCVRWFEESANKELKDLNIARSGVSRALLFNVTGKRDVTSLIVHLKDCGFDAVAFCPNKAFDADNDVIPEDILHNQREWNKVIHTAQCASRSFSSVESALKWVTAEGRKDATHLQILITGSLYLVGSTLRTLSPRLYD